MTPDGRRQTKGFRPGKEPRRLKKLRARQQFGAVGAAQERLIVLAIVLLGLRWRLHRQRETLEAMADAVSGRPGRKRRGG